MSGLHIASKVGTAALPHSLETITQLRLEDLRLLAEVLAEIYATTLDIRSADMLTDANAA
jgi:hypothetical protein